MKIERITVGLDLGDRYSRLCLLDALGGIDMHAHGQSNRGNEFQARDGVTTALELEDGVPDLAEFLETRGAGSVLNYGATVSHMAALHFKVDTNGKRGSGLPPSKGFSSI